MYHGTSDCNVNYHFWSERSYLHSFVFVYYSTDAKELAGPIQVTGQRLKQLNRIQHLYCASLHMQ